MTDYPVAKPASPGGLYELAMSGDWFGPGIPPYPAAQRTAGRAFDYPTAFNMRWTPKQGEGATFAELRALADNYDLLRLAIETRKDELEFCEWQIQTKDGDETAASKRLQIDLMTPDREHTWHQWQRMLLEELLVTDAPTIYPRKTRGGDPYSLEIVDGTTIKRVLDETGRTPIDGPAYQQVLHGVVTASFQRGELYYAPRNIRAYKVYGYSPVEQVMMTVNIALRRQAHQLSYYTVGSVPDYIFGVPDSWQQDQIKEFQTWWNSLFSEGNINNRRLATFIPGGIQPINTKDAALKDNYDEWLARIICFALNVSPQPLIAMMNRATAEVAEEVAKSSGLEPIKNWLKGLMDRIIAEVYGQPNLEFVWVQKNALQPKEQAEIHSIYLASGVLRVDEVRKEIGCEAIDVEVVDDAQPLPAPDGQPAMAGSVQDTALNGAQVSSLLQIVDAVSGGTLPHDSAKSIIAAAFPALGERMAAQIIDPIEVKEPEPAPSQLVAAQGQASPLQAEETAPDVPSSATAPDEKDDGADSNDEPPKKAPKPSTKVQKRIKPIKRDRPAMKKLESALKEHVAWMLSNAKAFYIEKAKGMFGKADTDSAGAAGNADFDFDIFRYDLESLLRRIATAGGEAAYEQLGVQVALDQLNVRAYEWAKGHAAELVKDISQATRESMNALTADAMKLGWGVDELAANIADSYEFSNRRSETIARTELAMADVRGNKLGYVESGVVTGLRWITANMGSDGRICDDCKRNHNAIVPMNNDGTAEKAYPSGAWGVPAHPNCLCDELPVIKDNE